MSKLRFTVVACSGEDPAFPARELNAHAASSKGFMTPRNCEYPQELVLQLLDGACRLTQVQLLSHQTHIATKIELFLSTSPSLHAAAFQRLGFLTLKSNAESNYMARELKTVHIDNDASFVKLLLHQCYANERNIYSQVGVMAVNLCGEPLALPLDALPAKSAGDGPARSLPKPAALATVTAAAAADDLGFDLRFDAKTAARIREIQLAKDQAVAMEDYDQAKRLKLMEEQLKSIGLQLARLEAQKRDAVANEDYDLAKRVKDEISLLEASVGSNESQPIPAHGNGYKSASPTYSAAGSGGGGGGNTQGQRSTARSQVLPRAAAAIVGGSKLGTASSSFSPRDMYPEDASQQSMARQRSSGGGSPSRPRTSVRNVQDDVEAEDEEEGEEPVEGRPNPNFRGIPDAENLPDPDEIPAALAKENQALIDVVGLFFTRCFYSNLWNHRDAAIRKVTMDLEQYPVDPVPLLEVCSTLVQSGTGDRIAQVALSAFRLVERMLSFGSRVRRDDMCHILGNSMTQLVNKLGEPQAKVRDEAAGVLLRLASAKNVGVAFVASHLAKRSKKPLGLKFLQGRLLVLRDLVAKFDLLPESDFSVGGILSFLEDNNCFAHQNREIRDPAKELTVALYQMVGAEVEGYLKSLRPKQLEEYQAAFEAAETVRASNARASVPAQRNGNANASSSGRQASVGRPQAQLPEEMRNRGNEDEEEDDDDESVDEYTCPFCGVVDEKFDSDRLDHHFWAECRMLSPCKMCGQVIEISCLNEHLLVECELRKNHRECPRCGEAITAKFFDKHVGLNDCLPSPHPKKASRCPLCHDDIAPGKHGWREHLIDDGCLNNPRTL
ncbi:hypothetical protein PybrP1_001443 [[Pythium] brassicae (nom. inval.)]|nr:hypothetical protein PybrP1_001443 [[Pythium] brassicae (nom. inval.)]